MLLGLLAELSRRTYARYIVASVGALAVDMGLFMALLHWGAPATPASTIGYVAGIAAHWLLSTRAVFIQEGSEHDGHRRKLLFVGSALVGLAITAMIVSAGAMLGIDPRLAKLAAIALSFNATYVLRKKVVFAA